MRTVLATMIGLLLAMGSGVGADVKTETVEYKVGDVTHKGFLAYDDDSAEKRPAVIIVPEWWGLTDYPKRRAHDVAQLGYVAFVADMYGQGRTTDDPAEAAKLSGALKEDRAGAMARAKGALEVVHKHPLVDGERIAAMGYCFGGTMSLEMARAGLPIVGAISFHGALATKHPAEAGKLKPKILALHGADDTFVPPDEVLAFAKEMQDAGADWQLVAYGGAVHSFTNPDADGFNIPGVKYNAAADRRSWEAMKDFLHEVFRSAGQPQARATSIQPDVGGSAVSR